MHAQGKLNALQEELLFAPKRSLEELYDIEADPYETLNLAEDPNYETVLKSLRQRLKVWMEETKDPGPESTEDYAAEMEYQIERNRRNPAAYAAVKGNVELYRRWATERPYVPLSE